MTQQHRVGERFGRYMTQADAQAVARSFRSKGYSVGVRKAHEYCWSVLILQEPSTSSEGSH